MANSDPDSSSMFMLKSSKNSVSSPQHSKANLLSEVITVKDFFDFMKTAYQVYEHLEGDEDGAKIDWEELTKLTVINHVLEPKERELLNQTAFNEQKTLSSKSETALVLEKKKNELWARKRLSCSEIEVKGRRQSFPPDAKVEMLGVWTEANLNCKLNDVINEGILDSILPYLVGYKKPIKTTSAYTPIIKKSPSTSAEVKKPASFGAFVNEKESKDRLGRRKSSVAAAQEKANQKQDGDVEIHVCDEVKGLKKDFRCPQKLLISKMGYFADVTAGQRLEDMDISVHCDIQIFDWLMRWVKRDSILVADWPLLDPNNVVPILVSASFLQMEPLLHDCLSYCHAHVNDIVNTSTNLACLNDVLLTRLAAMYTNAELEAIKDRKDKIQSRLYCKMIMSLGEPVPETLRGHYATLATLFKCSKCNKLLGRQIAEKVPCQPANMRLDRRGYVISTHSKDLSWSLNEYITWLYGELRSWRRVYWRLWADCHFLQCQLCDNYYPVYQMDWCSYHEPVAEGGALATGRHACCGERAFRFETITRNTGCQFRSHLPHERGCAESGVLALATRFRDLVAMRPPQLMLPDRLTRIVARDAGDDTGGRVHCKEVFWWEGIQLAPPRQTLGLLGKLFTSNTKFNPEARPGSPALAARSAPSLPAPPAPPTPERRPRPVRPNSRHQPGAEIVGGACAGGGDSTDSSEDSTDSSARSEEDAPRARPPPPPQTTSGRRGRSCGRGAGGCGARVWGGAASARSNQDAQRRYEERAAARMRHALARRHARSRPAQSPGGVYARLEAEWRERVGARARPAPSARARPQYLKYK
ncbi:uncharacterized protein KIAA1841 isoform X2 [Aricia agestis]|uniref:uncharacterized protein KIAA1841 isoform X2 n=1 Tax=Aricia agestis TaxID=91739 RepID=UPI001C2090E7|nr:uncharacterized protein KIAA1841 isoform X2 [Aricia agestis]